jgi:chromosome segregation ATPase
LAAGFAGGVDEDGQCGAEQVTRLRDEVKQAMGALHTVQRRIDKEAINVESLEELQTRMDALEVTSYDKHAALDRLSAEQAALSAQGMAECSGQVEALTVLQRELTAVKEGMSDVRQAMESAASREGALHADLAELRLLAERDEASNNGVQMPEFVAVCDSLRGEVQLMAEALRGSELSFRQAGIELSHRLEVGAAGQMSGEVVEVLQAYAAELKGLHAEMADIKGAVATSGLEPVLQELRSDLRQEQAANFELTSQVGRLHVLEEELAKRNLATQALRQEGEESRLRTQAEKMALEMTIVSLRQELSAMGETKCELGTRLGRLAALEAELGVRNQERDVLQQELREERDGKVDLLNRLVRMGELEEELASRKREGEALQEDSAERQVEVEREKRSLESALASLQNELQDERSSQAELLTRIGRIGEVEEELAGQRRAVESLRQAKEQAAGDAVAEKSRLEANLAEVVLARQVEVTSLNLALQEARNRALAEQEAVLALTGQVESLQASLRQLNEQQAQEQEGAEADLRHEVVTLKAKVAELQKKALAPDGVVLRKGSHSLPADVLRKWMAKDS